jgi:hypothetical protein
MLIAWVFVFYLSAKVIFRLQFNPMNVTTNGRLRVDEAYIELGNIDDFILIENLPSGRPIHYQITIIGVFVAEGLTKDETPCIEIETINQRQSLDIVFSSFPRLISGTIEDQISTTWMLRLTNFATIENESLHYGIIVSMITLMHIDR